MSELALYGAACPLQSRRRRVWGVGCTRPSMLRPRALGQGRLSSAPISPKVSGFDQHPESKTRNLKPKASALLLIEHSLIEESARVD